MADPAFNYALAKEDGFNDEQIASHLAKERDFNIDLAIQDGFDYSQIAQHLANQPPDEKGQFGQIADEVQRGVSRLLTDYPAFIKSFTDPEEAALTAMRKSEEVAAKLGTPPSLDAALQAWKDEGAINAAGEVVGDILPATAAQLPTIGTVWGGTAAGAAAGSFAGPPGGVIGGVVGGYTALFPQLLSANIQRQAQADIEAGREVDVEMSKAYMAAAAQTATEQLASYFILGKTLVGKMLRRPAVRGGDKKAGEALRALANRSLAGNVVRGATAGGAVEMSQEVAQQVMERWQAGLDLTSDDALAEYGEAAYQAALVGGTVSGVSRGIEGKTITPPPDPAQLLEREQQLIEEEARRIDDMVEPPMEDDVALEAWAETYPSPEPAAVPEAVPEVDTTTRTLGPRELQVEAETLVRGTSPTQSLTFTSQVLADGSGYQVADQAGNPYGRPVSDMEMGQQLALRMNQVKADQQILNSANDSINLAAGTAPSTSTRKTLLSIGNRVLNPRYNKVTFRELNAAGVVGDPLAEDSRRLAIQNLPLEQAEYYLTQGPQRSRAKSRAEMLRIFTPTQRLNYKRRAKGQGETAVFTMAEARTALKNKFGNLANPQVITPKVQERARMESPSIPISEREAGRKRKTKTLINEGLYRISEGAPKKVSIADLTKLLLQKNISSPLNSPAMKPLIKAFTGASNANAMTEGDRRVLYKNLNRFQAFEQSTKIPLFTARPFSAEQFSTVAEAVNSTGNMEDSFVAESANISPDDTATIKALQQELRKQRVIVNNKVRAFGQQTAAEADLLLAAPEGYAEEQAATQAEAAVRADRFKLLADLRTALNSYLDKRGLGDVKVRLDEAFEDAIAGNTQGFYDRDLRTVFFALDRIPDAASLTPEQLIASLENIMGHEMVHALRGMDLWTEAEWDSLVNATMQREKSDGETYMKWAVKNYPDKIPSIVQEEAVAEMIRDVIAGKSKVAGKPRNLIQRIFDFFERLANYLKVSQFNTFEEMVDGIIADVEGGVTGARERGVIRTPRRAIEEIESLGREPTTTMDSRLESRNLVEAVRQIADQRIAEEVAQGKRRRNIIKIEDIARALDEDHLATYGRKLDPTVTEDQLIAAQVIADDIKQQMTNDISGQGWYDADVQKAFMLLSEIPNLESLGTNEDNRVIWSAIAGPTSNNMEVPLNTRIATAAMLGYLRTGKIPTVPPAKGVVTEGIPNAGWGRNQGSVAKGMEVISTLVEKKGAEGFADWWLSPHSLKELTEIRKEAGLGGSPSGLSGGRDSYHLGAMIIGDKTGLFSLNINGYEGTTKDVWYTRSYNRAFGQMFGNTGKVQGSPRNQAERRQMEAFNRLVIDNIKEEELSEADAQAILWFHEQNLYTELGVVSRAGSFSQGVEAINGTIEIRQRVRGSDEGQAQVESEDALEGWRGISGRQRTIRSLRRAYSIEGRDSGIYDSETSGPYQRGSVEGYGADGLLSFSPDPAALDTYQAANLSLPEIEEVDSATNAESYSQDMREAMEAHPKGAQVTIKSPEELAEARLFRTASGSGFAVMPDGDVVAVFASPNEPKGGAYAMLQAAVQAGGKKLDAFDTYLPDIYETVGFRPVARVPWNDEFAPETWNKETFAAYNNGEPDIVFFVHDPDYFGGETNVPTVAEYADAVALQDEALDQVSQPIPAKLTTKPEDAEAVAADESKITDENRDTTEADQRANKKIEAVTTLASRTRPPEVTRDVAYTQVANLAADRAEKGLGDFEDGQVSWETPTDAGKRFKKTRKAADFLIFQAQDKYLDLKRDEAAINQAREKAGLPPLNALQSVYKGEESIHGIIAKAFEDVEFDEMRPLLAKMAETGVDLRQMDVFLILRHAIERNAHIRKINNDLKGTAEYNPNLEDGGSGSLTIDGVKHRLTDDYVKSVMRNDYGMTWNDSTNRWEGGNSRGVSISNLAKDYDQMGRRTLDVYKDSGLISDKDYDFLSSYYTYYAPLRGISPNEDIATEELIRERGTGSANLGIRGKELLTARGRESEAYGPLSTTYAERQRAIVRGAKNVHVGQRLLNLIRAHPNPDYWNITTEQKGGERIGVKENGIQYFVDIADPRLRGALLNLDAKQSGLTMGMARAVNRYLSLVNTSLNPEFVMGNFFRDLQTALGNLVGEQSMKGGLALDTKGLKRGIMKDVLPSIGQFLKGVRRSKNLKPEMQKLFDEYRRSGAKTDWYHARTPTESAKTIETLSQMAEGTFKGNTKARWGAVTNLVNDVNSAVENGVRFATFKKAKELFVKNGMSEKLAIAQAATLAKNLTVNFNRKGNSGELLNGLYLFFNASVQGTANFVRGIRSSRKKQALLTAMASWGALLTLLNEEFSDEDDETGRSYYDGIDDYQKERNMIFMKTMNPLYKGDPKDFYKIPLPYGYNVLHILGLNTMESLLGQKSQQEAATDIVAGAVGSFAPVGFSSSERGVVTRGAMAVVPQFFKPFAEILANENFFGAPIFRENMDFGTQLPRSSLSLTSTPEWLKTTTEFLNEISAIDGQGHKFKSGMVDISPDQAAHFIRTFTGGTGKFIERSAKSIDALSDYARDEYREGDISVNDIPLIRRVMGEATSRESQSDYYDRRDDIFAMYAYVRSDELKGAERTEYIAKNRDYLRMKGFLDAMDKRLSGINKRLRVVTERLLETPSMPITLRLQDEQERLEDLKTQVYDRFNKRFDALIGREK